MKAPTLVLTLTVLLLTAACGSQPKETGVESTPALVSEAAAPAPAPAAEGPQTDVQACEGKAAKDQCSYAEVKGTCVRGDDYSLKCKMKKARK